MTEASDDWLDLEARRFGDKMADLLARTLPGAPGVKVAVVGEKSRLTPDGQYVDENGKEHGGVPLAVNDGTDLAWLRVNVACRADSVERYLAVDGSKFWVVSTKDRSPLIRFEFNYTSRTEPHAHIQVHAERGAFSHLLSRTGHKRAHDLSALHLPTGGSRFRPSLEDVIQFLIVDCRVRSVAGWEEAVKEHRADWRANQTAAAARAMPAQAARALREIGYTVTPPESGDPEPGQKARYAW